MVNNYIKIEINGKEAGLKFGFPQAKEFAIAIGANLEMFFDGDNYSPYALAKMIYTAYKNNCLMKEVAPLITFEEISDWVDGAVSNEERKKLLFSIVQVWQESEYTKSWLDQVKKKTGEILKELEKINQPTTSKKGSSKSKPRSGGKATVRKK
jgi:hypothetical protein